MKKGTLDKKEGAWGVVSMTVVGIKKMYGTSVSGLPSVSVVRISEASASRRLLIY